MRHLAPLVAALALLAALPALAPAAAPDTETVTRTAQLDGAPVRPGVPVDFLAVQWRGPAEGARVRLHLAGRWGAWRALPHGELHRPGLRASELLAAGGATAYQVRLPRGARDGEATAIVTPGRGALATAAGERPQADAQPGRCHRTRAAWGADESLRGPTPPPAFPVQKLTLHHTATEGVDPVAHVQAIYVHHTVVLGFDDIGYHLLVDEEGCTYEGRHSGDDALPVFGAPAPDGTPQAVNGAHTAGFNAANVGVAVLGDFTHRAPTPAAVRAASRALAWVAGRSGLDSLGSGVYVNPISGATRDVATISGHRDWLATECPGARLHPLLPRIRAHVASLLDA